MKDMVDAFYEKFKSQALTTSGCDLCPMRYKGIYGPAVCGYYQKGILFTAPDGRPSWCKVRHIIVIKER